jgi:hypothetical protein
MGLDPTWDKDDHTLAVPAATTNPIYQSPPEYDSEGGREVYMVGNREELPDKMVEGIQRETDEELARSAYLVKDAERGKRHNGLHYD